MVYFLRTCKDLRLRVYCFFSKEGMGICLILIPCKILGTHLNKTILYTFEAFTQYQLIFVILVRCSKFVNQFENSLK